MAHLGEERAFGLIGLLGRDHRPLQFGGPLGDLLFEFLVSLPEAFPGLLGIAPCNLQFGVPLLDGPQHEVEGTGEGADLIVAPLFHPHRVILVAGDGAGGIGEVRDRSGDRALHPMGDDHRQQAGAQEDDRHRAQSIAKPLRRQLGHARLEVEFAQFPPVLGPESDESRDLVRRKAQVDMLGQRDELGCSRLDVFHQQPVSRREDRGGHNGFVSLERGQRYIRCRLIFFHRANDRFDQQALGSLQPVVDLVLKTKDLQQIKPADRGHQRHCADRDDQQAKLPAKGNGEGCGWFHEFHSPAEGPAEDREHGQGLDGDPAPRTVVSLSKTVSRWNGLSNILLGGTQRVK